jgi:hypothetical protein
LFLIELEGVKRIAGACIQLGSELGGRMVVPKTSKNGNNSLFGIRNQFSSILWIDALEADPTSEP